MNEVTFRVLATSIYSKGAWRTNPIDFTSEFNHPDLFFDEDGINSILKFMRINHRFISGDGFP